MADENPDFSNPSGPMQEAWRRIAGLRYQGHCGESTSERIERERHNGAIDAALDEVDALRTAVAWYAAPINWLGRHHTKIAEASYTGSICTGGYSISITAGYALPHAICDGGHYAREVLKG